MGESGVEVSRVPADLVDTVWSQIAPMVERGLRHYASDYTTPHHLLSSVHRGEMELWAVHDTAEIIAGIFMAVRQYRAKKSVVVEFAAGREMERWIGHMERLWRDYRDLVGADSIEASCRLGMAKRLSKRGWRKKAVVMELD